VPKGSSKRDLVRIGDRDGWVCGICRDPARPMHRPLGTLTILASELIAEDVGPEELLDWPIEDTHETARRYDPLAASIDHIVPRSRGGTNDDGNLQIAHLRCNLLKHDDAHPPSAEYARARLRLTLSATPVPFGVWRRERARRQRDLSRRGTPARRRYARLPPSWMIERGEVTVEPWRLLVRYQVRRMHRKYRRRKLAARAGANTH
jgi:HNH endonuclease